jgi:flagellar hook-associated protein 3 FlgL
MRISTNQIFEQSVSGMLDQQAQVAKTQSQISSGRRVLTPSDDPAAASRILDITQAIETTQQYQGNNDVAKTRLGLEDNALSSVGNLLQRMRELVLLANNDSQTNESRHAIAQEGRQRLQELVGLANAKDSNNEYLFAGYKGITTPFTANGAGGYDYNGDQGQRFLKAGPSLQVAVSDSGAEVFQLIKNGNGAFTTADGLSNTGSAVINAAGLNGAFVPDTYTLAFAQTTPTSPITYTVTGAASGVVASGNYTSGATITFNGAQVNVAGAPADGDTFTVSASTNQSMFATVTNFINAIETNVSDPASAARLHNAMNRALSDFDQSLGNVLETRATVGTRINSLESESDANGSLILQLQKSLSDVQDLDYAEAISRLNQQLLSLQAAQQAFVKVQGLSLFNYLK